MIKNRKRKQRKNQHSRKRKHNIPHFPNSIEIFKISFQPKYVKFKIFFLHNLQVVKFEKMKLRKRFQPRNGRKNFYRKLPRIRHMREKIRIRHPHWIVIIIRRKTVFQIPNFIISRKIILKNPSCSNNNFTFFIQNIHKRLRPLCIGHFRGIKCDFFFPNIFRIFKKIFKTLKQNIVWKNNNETWYEKRKNFFWRDNIISRQKNVKIFRSFSHFFRKNFRKIFFIFRKIFSKIFNRKIIFFQPAKRRLRKKNLQNLMNRQNIFHRDSANHRHLIC